MESRSFLIDFYLILYKHSAVPYNSSLYPPLPGTQSGRGLSF
jgi:hypothetical protein